MTPILGLAAGAGIGVILRLARTRTTKKPRGPLCPVCHVGGGWHRMGPHEAEAVS